MKFISKSSNLLVILRPGLSAQPLTGTPAKPSVSVRFEDGVAEVQQEDLIKMMKNHPGFESDFISAEANVADPYAVTRIEKEPAHELADIKYGAPEGRVIKGGPKPKISPAIQKLIAESAAALAKQMLPDMVKETLKAIVDSKKDEDGPKPDNSIKDLPEKVVASDLDLVDLETVPSSDEEVTTDEPKVVSSYGKGSKKRKKE